MEMPGSLPNNNENSATHQHHGLKIIEVREQNGNQENNIEIVNQDMGISSGNNKRRRKESKVWEKMTKYEGKDGKVWAKCTHCEKVFDGSSKKGTTHLKNHLERCQFKTKNEGGDADKSMKIAIDLTYPLEIKEKSVIVLIKNWLDGKGDHSEDWNPSVLNSRKVGILRVYEEEKEKLREFLNNLSCRFSLRIQLVSCWYILTVHYIDDSWEPKWKVIGIQKAGRHKFWNIIATLIESCMDFKIDGHICSIVYDIDVVVHDDVNKDINSWFSQRGSLLFGGSLYTIRRSFDSFYSDFGEWLWDSCSRVRRCIGYAKKTESNYRQFQMAVDNAESRGKKVTSSHGPFFAYNDFNDFKDAVGYKEAFFELEQIDPDFKSINLTKEQWDDAIVTYDHLKELTDSIGSLTRSQYTAPNTYFPKFCDVYMKLLPRETSESYHLGKKTPTLALIEKLASIRKKFLDRYWRKYNLVLVITVVLDPRFKMEIVQLWYNKIYGVDAESYLEKINDDFINVYNKYTRCGSTSRDATSSISYLDAMGRPHKSSEGVSSKLELDRYLNDDPKCPPYEKLDILAWWRANTEIYPTLARMARDFLAVPISFSFSPVYFDMLFRSIRNDLDDDIRPALVCLTDWLNCSKK